jgi:hypothetical protein
VYSVIRYALPSIPIGARKHRTHARTTNVYSDLLLNMNIREKSQSLSENMEMVTGVAMYKRRDKTQKKVEGKNWGELKEIKEQRGNEENELV